MADHISPETETLADALDAIFDRITVSCDWRLSSEERQSIAEAANALRSRVAQRPAVQEALEHARAYIDADVESMEPGWRSAKAIVELIDAALSDTSTDRPEEITKAEMDAIEAVAIAGKPLTSTDRPQTLVLTEDQQATLQRIANARAAGIALHPFWLDFEAALTQSSPDRSSE